MTLQSTPLPRSHSLLQTHKPNRPLFCQLTLHLFHKHVKPSHLYILIIFPFNSASSLYPTTKIRILGVMLDCSFLSDSLPLLSFNILSISLLKYPSHPSPPPYPHSCYLSSNFHFLVHISSFMGPCNGLPISLFTSSSPTFFFL